MEAIIKTVEGDDVSSKSTCMFCRKHATHLFGIIDTKPKHNGHRIDGFYACEKHITCINRLLDGSYDIDRLMVEMNKISDFGVNLHDY